VKNITQHTGKLEILERLPNSVNGNPRYRVSVDGFSAVTKLDSSIAYSLTNYRDQVVTAHIGTHYGQATIDNLWGPK
jgi:hypothetical protein